MLKPTDTGKRDDGATTSGLVTDDGGLDSAPDEVEIGTNNLAPTADAGDDMIAFAGDTVYLDGSESSDPETDPLSYAWALIAWPAGSMATLFDDDTVAPRFTPDVEGDYEIELMVSDFIGPGWPDTVEIMAITAEDLAEERILDSSDLVADLTLDQVTTRGNRTALRNFLRQAVEALQAGDVAEAIDKLTKAQARTDGCVMRGLPDGNGSGRDWVTDCAEQIELYALIQEALDALM